MIRSQMICKSGTRCPESGMWQNIDFFTTTILMTKGHKMPEYCGKKVSWKLIYKA
ncbi:hypothetical protein [Elizabethkingia ursingii]|uniref:hypothetical protein n=1 Tax=Elizabethkingia ursingii TaxID=1756150 RepID=UPI0013F66A68|nr:hypothetical protein [Elizabethkingia ursingii]MCL1665796.1 hypothetical protein [Elizabethkingia ursingii]MCL1670930.1 hypothetical protein [Elizabethkingia ursingii]